MQIWIRFLYCRDVGALYTLRYFRIWCTVHRLIAIFSNLGPYSKQCCVVLSCPLNPVVACHFDVDRHDFAEEHVHAVWFRLWVHAVEVLV